MIGYAWRVFRAVARWLHELRDDRPRVSRSTLEAALRRQDMDRHPVELDPEVGTDGLGQPLAPGDVRKAPVFPNGRK